MNFVREFKSGKLNLNRLNYAMIMLIPKEPKAKHLKEVQTHQLYHYNFKIFAKALNNRLIEVAERLISPNQTTFIKVIFILEIVVEDMKLFMIFIEKGNQYYPEVRL